MKKHQAIVNEENISLSVRSSVYLAGMIMTGVALMTRSSDLLAMFLVALALIVLWSIAMRPWQRRVLKPLVMIVNIILTAACITVADLLGADVDPGEYIYLMPLTAGLTALGSENGDNSEEFRRCDPVGELILPAAVALASMAPSVLLCIMGERKLTSVGIIASALTLILLSAVSSTFTGRTIRFSSPVLTDYSTTPASSSVNLRGFILARGLFALSLIPAIAVAYASRKAYYTYLRSDYEELILIIPLGAAVLLTLASIAADKLLSSGGSKAGAFLSYEMTAAVAMTALPFILNDNMGADRARAVLLLVFYYLGVVMADVLATGYLTAYKRRSISSERPACADGLPLMLIVGGLSVMCVEAVTLL